MGRISTAVKTVNELNWEGIDGRWAWWVTVFYSWGTQRKRSWQQDGNGGWLHQYAYMDLSRGLGSDTSFEQSHATSKTFKWSSPLLQIKLQGWESVCVSMCVQLCLRGVRRRQRRRKKRNQGMKRLKERCVCAGLSSLSVSERSFTSIHTCMSVQKSLRYWRCETLWCWILRTQHGDFTG